VTVVGAHHTAFQVGDLARSLAFYRDLLGFEVVWERVNREEYVRQIVGYPEAELHQALLRFPGSDHCLELIDYRGVDRTAVDTSPPNPGTAHICLVVRDLRGFYDHLRAAGVGAVGEPVLVTSGANAGRLAVYMIDPDGFRVELLSVEAESAA
jgi:catechol 2,3-dioxygenase-like lactoylglutathione lyase family enzyme